MPAALRTILHKSRFGVIKNETAYLKENSKEAELKLVKVTNIPDNSILLACDGAKTDTLFQKGNGQNMRCDYLLISNGVAYFIELKTSSKSEDKYYEDCIKKFKAVECIADYIDSVIERFYKKDKIFFTLEKRYILIYKEPPLSINTTSMKPKEKPCNDKPETMSFLPVKNEEEIDISTLDNCDLNTNA
ncbi:MAG: hypothetical protein AB7U85_11185 [Alphaproteobacteria bacterium]